jgi:Sap, sulfolipid-1-addressing protein
LWGELILLAVVSAFWPALIAIVLVALRTRNPVKLLSFFLAGGLISGVTVGLVLIFTLQDTSFVSGSNPPVNPVLYFTVGVLCLLVALVLAKRPPKEKPKPTPEEAARRHTPWSERALARGAAVAFVVGLVINCMPGFFNFLALMNIAQLGYSTAVTVVLVICFDLVMFSSVEIPLVAYRVNPKRTAERVAAFNEWLNRNGRLVVVYLSAGIGVYLIVRGIVSVL